MTNYTIDLEAELERMTEAHRRDPWQGVDFEEIKSSWGPKKWWQTERAKMAAAIAQSEAHRLLPLAVAEIEHHRESIRCMSVFLNECAVTMGTKTGDAEGLGEAILAVKEENESLREALAELLFLLLALLTNPFLRGHFTRLDSVAISPETDLGLHMVSMKSLG